MVNVLQGSNLAPYAHFGPSVNTGANNNYPDPIQNLTQNQIKERTGNNTATKIVWSKDDSNENKEGLDNEDKSKLDNAGNAGITPGANNLNDVKDATTLLPKDVAEKIRKALKDAADKAKLADAKLDTSKILEENKKSIDKEENKRTAIGMLGFAIALMGGDNATAAANFANKLAAGSEKKINYLYKQRTKISEGLISSALKQAGYSTGTNAGDKSVGTVGWEFSDGEVYFQVQDPSSPNGYYWDNGNGKKPPAGSKPTKKVGTGSYGDLPKWVGNTLVDASKTVRTENLKLARIEDLVNTKQDAWDGIFGKGAEAWKKLFGGQDANSEYRRLIEELIGQESLTNLPPGTASDRDIKIVRNAQVNGFANAEGVRNWLAALKRISNYKIKYAQAYLDYFKNSEHRDPTGFKPPAYEGLASQNANNATNNNNLSSSDLDSIIGK